jgi:hypothetical protein
METVIGGLGALAVANIYYWYRSYLQRQVGRERKLRERVTYMLWVAASRLET